MKLINSSLNAILRRRIKHVSFAAVAVFMTLSGFANAASVGNVISAEQKKLKMAQASQKKVDGLSDNRRTLYNEYKAINKEIDDLRIYNKQLNKQILDQRKEMERIQTNIEGITVMQRRIPPLMLRMIDGLKQFIALDLPFLKDEREGRIERLEETMEATDVSIAEKFRAVIGAYQIENDYGTTIETTSSTININGEDKVVDILKFGRIAMVYQTRDRANSGYWDQETQQWISTDSGSDRSNITLGLKIANKQAPKDMIILPVKGPEAVQ